MDKNRGNSGSILQLGFQPPPGYRLDLEILPLSVLRQRASPAHLQSPHRLAFHLLICVTAGRCRHWVDFDSIGCGPGSVLMLRPGMVQGFGPESDWDGWLLLFRPEFLQPGDARGLVSELEVFRQLEALPAHLSLQVEEQAAVVEGIARMFQDTRLEARIGSRHALLRSQLHALITRLHLAQERCEQDGRRAPLALQRYKRYRQLLEQEFCRRHQVADYARLLGCSEKTLGRATQEVAGVGAKALLCQRLALEAKRLLAHTAMPVAAVADRLGFEEASNFVKFFRREAGCTPRDFRRRQGER